MAVFTREVVLGSIEGAGLVLNLLAEIATRLFSFGIALFVQEIGPVIQDIIRQTPAAPFAATDVDFGKEELFNEMVEGAVYAGISLGATVFTDKVQVQIFTSTFFKKLFEIGISSGLKVADDRI